MYYYKFSIQKLNKNSKLNLYIFLLFQGKSKINTKKIKLNFRSHRTFFERKKIRNIKNQKLKILPLVNIIRMAQEQTNQK